ncbi:MAG TPA: hypothetical protein VH639_10565 [Bryobacteraceae bacterium]
MFIPAYGVMYMPSVSEWAGRLVLVACLFAGILALSLGTSLNPRARYIRGGKLAQPGKERQRKIAERVIRILVFSFGVFFVVQVIIPFVADCAELARTRSPVMVGGVAARIRLVPLIQEQVNLMRDGSVELRAYTMFFPARPFRSGQRLSLVVLPRSRVILAAHEVGPSEGRE